MRPAIKGWKVSRKNVELNEDAMAKRLPNIDCLHTRPLTNLYQPAARHQKQNVPFNFRNCPLLPQGLYVVVRSTKPILILLKN